MSCGPYVAKGSVSRHRARLPSCQVRSSAMSVTPRRYFRDGDRLGRPCLGRRCVLFMAVLTRSSAELGTHTARIADPWLIGGLPSSQPILAGGDCAAHRSRSSVVDTGYCSMINHSFVSHRSFAVERVVSTSPVSFALRVADRLIVRLFARERARSWLCNSTILQPCSNVRHVP